MKKELSQKTVAVLFLIFPHIGKIYLLYQKWDKHRISLKF